MQSGIVQGSVRNASGSAFGDASIRLINGDDRFTSTDPNGHFFFNHVSPGESVLMVSKAGYYDLRLIEEISPNRPRVVRPELHPICEGALFGQVIVLDARYGGDERGIPPGSADINLAVVNALSEILRIAGAKVYLIRKKDQNIPVSKRFAAVNTIKNNGYYLRIDHGSWADHAPSVVAAHYPGNQVAECFVKSILDYLDLGGDELPKKTFQDPDSPEIRSTNKIALSLEVRSINHPTIGITGSRTQVVMEAYSIFLGACKFFRAKNLPSTRLEVHVMDQASGKPLTNANVALDGTLQLVTDRSGSLIFQGFSPRTYRLVVSADGYTGRESTIDTTRRKRIVIELKPTETHVPKDASRDAVFLGSGCIMSLRPKP